MAKINTMLSVNHYQQRRLESLKTRYRCLFEAPDQAAPMIIINIPASPPSWREHLADPMVMLRAQLDDIQNHFAIEDDYFPSVRVEFGTGQVAAAFGCDVAVFEDHPPCARGPVLHHIDEINELSMPSLRAGWCAKLEQWTNIWHKHLPEEIPIQHPDIQSPFNNAHLIRGNDLLMDFYDHPDQVELLLDMITDYMLQLVKWFVDLNHSDSDGFADWGVWWKGVARISNCSTDMIGPDLYRKYILSRDRRFLHEIGGGRMHYCGTSADVLHVFFQISELTGFDCDAQYHNMWQLAQMMPPQVPLIAQQYGRAYPELDRLLRGDWPDKRNIILFTEAENITHARQLLADLKKSIPD